MTEEVQIPGRHRQRKPIVIARLPSSLSDDEEKAETEEACLQKTPVPHQEEVTPDDAKPGPEPGLVEQEKEPSRLVRQTRDIWREQMISQDFEKATVVAESRVKKDHDTGSTKRESHDKVHKGSYGSHGLDNPTVTGQYGSAKCTHASPRKEFPTTKFRKVKREAASSSQRAASALPLIGTYFDFVDNDVGDDLPEEENPHLVEAELVDPEAECHSDEDKVLVTAVAAPMRGFNCKWYAIVLIALFIVVGVVVSVVMTKANTSTVESATGRNHVGSRWTNATTKGPDNVTDVYEQEHEPGRQNDSSAAAYSSAEYSAIFSANFRIETSKLLEGMICGVNATGLNVECLNGPIVLLQNTSTMSCEPSDNDDSIVECYTRQNGISLNTWDSVIFVSIMLSLHNYP